ncbi:MAG: hypothetical protein ACKVII_04685 [Planctomycetales bacterium]
MSDMPDEPFSRRACLKIAAASASALATGDVLSTAALGESPSPPRIPT